MGNLRQEHNFSTSDVPGGLGIAQWMGGRRAKLMQKPNYLDLQVQLEFVIEELNGSESRAGNAIKQAQSVEQSTIAFQSLYERCGKCMQSQRINYAYQFFNKY